MQGEKMTNKSPIREFALLGVTASGKTSLALELAQKYDGVILSLDSLSIYRGIDIASAKPTAEERGDIKHFGIDIINPDEIFNVTMFFTLYQEAYEYAQKNNKTLIIVGGTSFYLKAMLTGLSDKPLVSEAVQKKVSRKLTHIDEAYEFISSTDSVYAQNISSKDRYRMEKWFEIYYETGVTPSVYLKQTLKKPVIENIDIYELTIERDILREKIELRTKHMLDSGLIAEIVGLEKRYGRLPRCMKAIGIKEVLSYLDGEFSLDEMREKIVTNTYKLAKRQRTFNKSQFTNFHIQRGEKEELLGLI